MHYDVSRVSPDGNYLLFATNLKVRESDGEEYENRDQVTNEPDYEYYEYSLASVSVTCVSCNPDRAERPIQRGLHGVLGCFPDQRERLPAAQSERHTARCSSTASIRS